MKTTVAPKPQTPTFGQMTAQDAPDLTGHQAPDLETFPIGFCYDDFMQLRSEVVGLLRIVWSRLTRL